MTGEVFFWLDSVVKRIKSDRNCTISKLSV